MIDDVWIDTVRALPEPVNWSIVENDGARALVQEQRRLEDTMARNKKRAQGVDCIHFLQDERI